MADPPKNGPKTLSNHDAAFDYAAINAAFAAAAAAKGFKPHGLLTHPNPETSLWTRKAENSRSPLTIFISAGMHGDEPAGPLALLSLLEGNAFSTNFDWILAPVLNPTGLAKGTRENASGIDLNRDFLRAATEEVQALTNWWKRNPPAGNLLHLSLHEDWETSGFYFYAINTSPIPCFSGPLQKRLSQLIPLQSEGPVDDHPLDAPGLIIHRCEADEPDGWPEAIWLTKNFPTLSYTFEAPSSQPLEMRSRGLATCITTSIELATNLPNSLHP